MPILRVETSVPLPAHTSRTEALAAIAECIVRRLDVKPVQVRVTLAELDPENVLVGGTSGAAAAPYVVGWASILEGRPEAKRVAFIADMLELLARTYGVDESAVRVIVTDFPSVHWGMGRAPATAKG